MRKKKSPEQKIVQLQSSLESMRQQTADAHAKSEQLQKMIADKEAERAILKRFVSELSNDKDILQKKVDGIPLLPHEEAIFNFIHNPISSQDERFIF